MANALFATIGLLAATAGAQFTGPCSRTEYCSSAIGSCMRVPPDGPVACQADGSACPTGHACDSITLTCMLTGAECVSTCTTSDAYCSPVGKHCFKPTNKGALCQSRADCSGEEYCCPVTKVCALPDAQTVCEPSGEFPAEADMEREFKSQLPRTDMVTKAATATVDARADSYVTEPHHERVMKDRAKKLERRIERAFRKAQTLQSYLQDFMSLERRQRALTQERQDMARTLAEAPSNDDDGT